MPELAVYDPNPLVLENLGKREFDARAEAITATWAYYNGAQKRPLKIRDGQNWDDNIILNLWQSVADKTVSMLFGQGIEWEIQDGERTEQELFLDDVWERSRKAILLHDLALNGALCGHVFMRIKPQPDGSLRLINLNPANMTVFWRPDDIETVTCYRLQTIGALGQEERGFRQDFVPTDNGTWLIREFHADRAGRWQPAVETPWPYDFPPIVDWKNLPAPNEYYGNPDLAYMHLQDNVNLAASNTFRILIHHAHPKTIGTGVRANELNASGIDNFWTIPAADAKVFNLEMQSDLQSSLAFYRELRASFFSVHRAVDVTTLYDKVGQLTNFGLRTIYKDALDKNETKRTLYGDGLEETNRRLHVIKYGVDPEGMTSHWPDPLPYNDLEEISSLRTELEMGIVSKQTAAEVRGRDWDTEMERMAAEKAMDDNVGAALLNAFERGGSAPTGLNMPMQTQVAAEGGENAPA